MRNPRIIYLTLVVLILPLLTNAQPGQIRFQPLEGAENVGSIGSVYQDSLGFFWLNSSRGLTMWDGAETTLFTHSDADTLSIAGNDIQGIAFDSDHNVWVASTNGLSCINRRTGKSKTFERGKRFVSVLCDGKGSIWAGTRKNGLYRISSGSSELVNYTHDPENPTSIAGDRVPIICKAKNGDLWFAISGVGISILKKGEDEFEQFLFDPDHPERLPSARFRDIMQARDGTFWIAASKGGVTHYFPETDEFEHYMPDPDDQNSLSSTEAFCLMEDREGLIWIGTWARGLNILNPKTNEIRRFRHQPDFANSIPDDVITNVFQDRQGLIWVGSSYGELAVVDPQQFIFTHYRNNPQNSNSLSQDFVRGVYEVSEDELWIGTNNGGLNIYHRKDNRFELEVNDPDDPNSFPYNGIWDILKDKKGRMWVATSDGICRWRPASRDWFRIQGTPEDPHTLSAGTLLSFAEAPDGMIWAGTWNKGLNAVEPESGFTHRFMPSDEPGGLPRCGIKDLHFDSKDRLWLATTEGLALFLSSDSTFQLFQPEPGNPNSITSKSTHCLAEDAQGRILIGTANGLNIFDPKGSTFTSYSIDDGLASNEIVGIEIDQNGYLWLSTHFGLNRMEPQTGQIKIFTYKDGLPSNELGLWSSHKGQSGRLYFGSSNGLCEFDPLQLTLDTTPSPTAITGFFLFNQPAVIHEDSILTQSLPFTDQITLNYSDYIFAFSLSSLGNRKNKNCEYAYRLKGFNEEWIYTDQKNRRATFTNVPHGDYVFQVRSKNGNGVWDNTGTELKVRILPPWWKTWWARGLGILLLLGIAYGIYWSRVSTLRRQKAMLEKRVREATAEVVLQNRLLSEQKEEIEKEKERSDELLLNILPEAVAEELKRDNKATPRYFPEVSILFTDFVDFTKLSEGMTPQALVEVLDAIFREFDRIVERHQLEKIKTIGDAYMCAGGLHNEPQGQATRVLSAGLEMVETVKRFNESQKAAGLPEWNIRLGIHTGEVVAGVVGEKKFQFDIWGDAVNTASRMESSGSKNRVNISDATYKRVKDVFLCTPRGKIAAKNKGEIEMFLVENRLE